MTSQLPPSSDRPSPRGPFGVGPKLRIAVADQVRTLAPGQEWVIGRGRDVDVVVPAPLVSRRHAIVRQAADGWVIVDADSVNGLWHEGRRVTDLALRDGPVTVRLGGPDGPAVTMVPVMALEDDPTPAAPAPLVGGDERTAVDAASGGPLVHQLPGLVRIGRSATNDMVLEDLLVSRRHAELKVTADGPELRDLGSGNGTYVNGKAIDRCLLRAGDLVGVGAYTLRFDGSMLLQLAEPDGVGLAVGHLSVDGDGGQRIVDDVSFSLAPGTLMAVVGPSGAGKSTLVQAVAGLHQASSGSVYYAGRDLYANYDELRQRIGFVPQDDIVHRVLTVRQALGFAARLRFPADTSADERSGRVQEVAAELRLINRLDNRIHRLSGGERKRVSAAMELLTKPPLLFLDEATSGLDVDLDREVMQHLRRLAEGGRRTIIIVTHHVENLAESNVVMVLTPGGEVAFLGPPGEVIEYFGVRSWADLFHELKERPAQWAAKFRESPRRDWRANAPQVGAAAASAAVLEPPPRRSLGTQFVTLLRRQVAVTAADRMLLAILILTPVLLALIARVIPSPQGLAHQVGNKDAVQLLLVLTVGAALAGAAGTVRELAKERALYEREHAVGLSPAAYLTSKVLLFTLIGAVQGAVLTTLAVAGRPPPDQALALPSATLEIAAVVAVLTAVCAAFGLLLSAAVRDENQAMPLLVLLTMAQLVMCGGLVPISGRAGLEQLSWILPSRWGFAAQAATVDLRFLAGEPDGDTLWQHSGHTWWLDVGILTVLGVSAVFATALLLHQRSAIKRAR